MTGFPYTVKSECEGSVITLLLAVRTFRGHYGWLQIECHFYQNTKSHDTVKSDTYSECMTGLS
jgi:hypothetical protein